MRTLLGTELHKDDQRYVLGAYVHRYTGNHKPQWAVNTNYPLQFINDADWLAHTSFRVTTKGRLDSRCRFCQSSPTWPNNPELRKKV